MMIFLVTLGFFLIIAAGMAVGYIFQQKTLAGSCGGLGSVGIEKACNCDSPCEKRQERERIAAQERDKSCSINIKNI
ncbi:(Na+)-NQR maturation NqrM [Colwellia sp. 1_MG-2023]|uniref:(Na+)-NQR maturation NqrM n=1 Tax=Colwellia sp. 1_MG-2023 TaxID=3062649 RepID=UPI0026E3E8CC|nr:(Na+)-NQR maturation NqrM [Colwellia sp. 1_MG-2023]MDO6444208.1 (Na+)-NQR maturation NqrM [Colwellia sp. 1_MG-2023]